MSNAPISFLILQESKRRQPLDAGGLFAALETAQEEAWRHSGSLFWREQFGRSYLIKLSNSSVHRLVLAGVGDEAGPALGHLAELILHAQGSTTERVPKVKCAALRVATA
jgi:hypothetical protein